MERREALKYVGLITGGTLISSQLFILGCKPNHTSENDSPNEILNANQIALLNDIGEIIIPTTDTPGAKAANVGFMMSVNIRDCYGKEKQDSFVNGLGLLNHKSRSFFKDDFSNISNEDKVSLITELDSEVYDSTKKNEDDIHIFYRITKELTLLGYFTSEICLTKHLEYIPIPTKYDGAMAYDGKSKMKIFGSGL